MIEHRHLKECCCVVDVVVPHCLVAIPQILIPTNQSNPQIHNPTTTVSYTPTSQNKITTVPVPVTVPVLVIVHFT
jgi:hypothetical protein